MISVLNPGFYTTVQDLGRFGYQKYGVPVSGAMDLNSAKQANVLIGNNEHDAVLEITIIGPKLQFHVHTHICISGANLLPRLNSIPIELNTPIVIKKDDVLSFDKLNSGIRSYLAVSGGFKTNVVMNSRSMYKNITKEFVVKKDDILPIREDFTNPKTVYKEIINIEFNSKILKVYKGPEFDRLSISEKENLFSQEFTISKENNRMAYQLSEAVQNNLTPIITSLVLPGTVQLTPSGKLIILMRDCQTTGGYPRVLQLNEKAVNILSQKFTNDKIQFNLLKNV